MTQQHEARLVERHEAASLKVESLLDQCPSEFLIAFGAFLAAESEMNEQQQQTITAQAARIAELEAEFDQLLGRYQDTEAALAHKDIPDAQ